MAKTVQFVVKLELPEGVTKQGAADYVREAVQGWKGGLWHGDASHHDHEAHEPDLLFLLDPDKVTVRPYCEFGSSEAGKLGGKARAEKLSKERRTEIAQKAAAVRWGKEILEVGG